MMLGPERRRDLEGSPELHATLSVAWEAVAVAVEAVTVAVAVAEAEAEAEAETECPPVAVE